MGEEKAAHWVFAGQRGAHPSRASPRPAQHSLSEKPISAQNFLALTRSHVFRYLAGAPLPLVFSLDTPPT